MQWNYFEIYLLFFGFVLIGFGLSVSDKSNSCKAFGARFTKKPTMIKIYYWQYMPPNRLPSIAMELSDGTYISDYTTIPKRSFQDDVDYEGRQPDDTINFPPGYLNEKTTRDWWVNYKKSCVSSKSTQFSGSAYIVREALRSGLSDITKRKPYLKCTFSWEFMISPEEIFKRATYIVWHLNNLKSAKIYFWKIIVLEKSVGHISLKLSDGTYISHWPTEHKGAKSTPPNPHLSLEMDCAADAEGRDPDEVLEFPVEFINEAQIKVWWNEFKKSGKYWLPTSNCAHIVCEAIKSGITDRLVKLILLQFGKEKQMNWSLLKKPSDAFDAVKITRKVLIENFDGSIVIKDYK